eukprot:6208917-Pleurochrysis_carterae.AAC.1
MQGLLSSGAILGGVWCPAEAPKTALDSAASRGKVSFDSELLGAALSLCEAEAVLYPLKKPATLQRGQCVFCPHKDRVSRGGWHGVLRSLYAEGTVEHIERLWLQRDKLAEDNFSQSVKAEPGIHQNALSSRFRRKLQAGNYWSVQPHFGPAALALVSENRVIPMLSGQFLQSRLQGRAAMQPPKDILVVCATTAVYRRLAAIEVHQLDCVLEIGCDLGATTALMHARCGKAIGVDLSDSSINIARANHSAACFRQLDIFQHGAFDRMREWGLAMNGCIAFSKVFIDINGNRPREAVAKAVLLVRRELGPSLIVVKSSELHAWVSSARRGAGDP